LNIVSLCIVVSSSNRRQFAADCRHQGHLHRNSSTVYQRRAVIYDCRTASHG